MQQQEIPEMKFTREYLQITKTAKPHEIIAVICHLHQKGLYLSEFRKNDTFEQKHLLLFSTNPDRKIQMSIKTHEYSFKSTMYSNSLNVSYFTKNTWFTMKNRFELIDPIEHKYKIRNPNQIVNKLSFFEENIDLITKLIDFEKNTIKGEDRIEFSINSIYKTKRYLHLLNNDSFLKISKSNISQLKKLFQKFKNLKLKNQVMSGPIKLSLALNKNPTISFGPFVLMKTFKIDKYKYINFTPTIFVANIICKTDLYEKLNANLNKMMLGEI